MKAVNIIWDIDEEDFLELRENGMLPPGEVLIPNHIQDLDEVADYLSDEYGFCVMSFNIDDYDE